MENFVRRADMQIARNRTEAVARKPELHIGRFDLAHLDETAARPIALHPANDESFSFQGFRFLMLHSFEKSLAQLMERHFLACWIDLRLFLAQSCQASLRQFFITRA